jgi:hypothetical protein
MFKRLRRLTMLLAAAGMVVSLILLANFTAPNPTGRRYSSAVPVTTGQGNSAQIGLSAERILAVDLDLPRNEDPDQLQCFCNSVNVRPPLNECRSCIAFAQLSSTGGYRRPDFVAAGFIAESKNTQNLLYSQTDTVAQIGDYAIGARALGRPLWLYIRVNTALAPEFYRLVESTGGGVVPYFAVPGYVDPVDQLARNLFILSGGTLGLMLVWEVLSRRRPPGGSGGSGGTSRRPRRPGPTNPLEEAQEFTARVKEKRRVEIEVEDARNALK